MTTTVDAPARADDVQLLGSMVGSGYRTPPSLVRRGDGQTLQLTPLLYEVLDAADGRRTCAEIAAVVGQAVQRAVPEDAVATVVDQHLRPLGLVKLADGSEPPLKRSDPLLGLKLKVRVTNPRTTHRLTDPFRFLFRPWVATAVTLGFLAVTWWVFFEQGLAPAAYDAFQRPHLLLLVFVVTMLSGGFHEFGHAAAARYSGAEPGVMGAGIYLVWPAFYTDVTDSYRLGRRGRIRTDLGGLYFNALVVVLTFAWWYYTEWDALLLLVATQTLQMVQQLLPLLRFDGYHLLADLAGVPDLYQRIRPTLVGLLPHRWSDPDNRLLKPGARAVITFWVLVTIPLMALMLLAVVAAVPRLLGTAWSVVSEDTAALLDGWSSGGPIDVAAHTLEVLGIVLPVLACVLILGRIGLRWSRGLTLWSRGSLARRVAAAALSSVVVTGLAWAWWPNPGTYRPIGPDDQGLLTSLLPTAQGVEAPVADAGLAPEAASVAGTAAEQRLSDGRPLIAPFQEGAELPTRSDPQLALVLVPSQDGEGSAADGEPGSTPTDSTDSDDDEPWVFPFDKPLPPDEGDNQALATNTTDGSVTYDVAFAMVWATGDEVLNVNEAHAYASCSDCVAVAVAFQVVLIMDDAQVVVPQNLAVAANYDCYRCITAAIASQLVLSVEGEPGEEQLLALGEVWNQLIELGQNITSYTLAQITAELDAIKSEIIEILDAAPPVQPSPDTTSPASPTGTASPDGESTSSDSPAPASPTQSTTSPSSEPSPTSEPSEEPSTDPSPQPTTTTPTQEPTTSTSSPSASPTPTSTP